jgi:hypothetical protein
MDTKIHTLGAFFGYPSQLVGYSLTLRKSARLGSRLRRSHENTLPSHSPRTRPWNLLLCRFQNGKTRESGEGTKEEARQIVDAKNQAERQPMLNLQLAKAYLAGTDAEMPKRTWQHALEVVTETKRGANKERWKRVAKDRALPCCGRR